MAKKKEDDKSSENGPVSDFEKELADVISSAKAMVETKQNVIQVSPALDIALSRWDTGRMFLSLYRPPEIW